MLVSAPVASTYNTKSMMTNSLMTVIAAWRYQMNLLALEESQPAHMEEEEEDR